MPHALIGLIGDEPDKWALVQSSPISAPNARALSTELQHIGLDLSSLRITNLWGHAPVTRPRGKDDSEAVQKWLKEYTEHYMRALTTVSQCKIVCLCGAGAIKAFISEEGEKFLGLTTTSSKLSGKIVIPSPALSSVAFRPLGEWQFCLQTIAKEIKRL